MYIQTLVRPQITILYSYYVSSTEVLLIVYSIRLKICIITCCKDHTKKNTPLSARSSEKQVWHLLAWYTDCGFFIYVLYVFQLSLKRFIKTNKETYLLKSVIKLSKTLNNYVQDKKAPLNSYNCYQFVHLFYSFIYQNSELTCP
jgi:hypothetical protein